MTRRRVQGLKEAWTMFLNMMVSEGIRPHQGCGVIHGHLGSGNKPSVLLWKLLMELSHIRRTQTLPCSPVELSVLGCDLGICLFYFYKNIIITHLYVHLCVCIFPVNIFFK